MQAIDLTAQVLESYMYKIEGSTSNTIFAEKDDLKLAVLVYTEDANIQAIHNFADHAEADKKLIIALKPLGPESHYLGIPVWSHDRFTLEVDKCKLAESERGPLILEIPELQERKNIIVEIQGTGKIIKPNIGEEDAVNLASEIKDPFKMDMQLVPMHIFGFRFTYGEVEGVESDEEFTSGLIGINAINSQATFWDEGIITIGRVEGIHHWVEPVCSQESCQDSARTEVVTRYSKTISKQIEDGAATVFERLEIKPDDATLTVEHRGLYYLPVWSIEGSGGIMQIDAVLGKSIFKEIYTF